MKTLINSIRSSTIPRYVYVVSAFIVTFIFFFLFDHALNGWFFQDDIRHLLVYKKSLQLQEIFTLVFGGRFIGHNVYWNTMYNLAGFNAAIYFMANLLIIIGNSLLLYNFVISFIKDKEIAILSGIIYFIMIPTLHNATWICNAGHLLNHSFIFAFGYYYFFNDRFLNLSIKDIVMLSLLFLGSLWTAQYGAFFIPSLIFFHILNYKKTPVKLKNIILLFLYLIILLIYLMIIKKKLTEIIGEDYATINISISSFINTLVLYSKYAFKNIFILLFIVIILLAVGIATKNNYILFLLLAAGFCYMPLAFNESKQSLNYLSVPFLLLNIGVIITIKNHVKIPSLLLLILLFNIVIDIPTLKDRADNPMGSSIKQFVYTMKSAIWQYDLHNYKKIYFIPLKKHENPTKTAVYDIPIFWHQIGGIYDGEFEKKVLPQLIDPSFEYIVKNTDDPIPPGYPVVVVDNFLFKKDEGIKKIIIPRDK